MWQLMGGHGGHAPDGIKGLALSAILSDTLEFRSPTTTPVDKRLAEMLAQDLGVRFADGLRPDLGTLEFQDP